MQCLGPAGTQTESRTDDIRPLNDGICEAGKRRRHQNVTARCARAVGSLRSACACAAPVIKTTHPQTIQHPSALTICPSRFRTARPMTATRLLCVPKPASDTGRVRVLAGRSVLRADAGIRELSCTRFDLRVGLGWPGGCWRQHHSGARVMIIVGAGRGTTRVSSFSFVVVAGPAIYPGETGSDDPQRAKKRWFHDGIRDASR